MTPRERTVIEAIARSLSTGIHVDMDALSTSYSVPERYVLSTPKARAALLLRALINKSDQRRGLWIKHKERKEK